MSGAHARALEDTCTPTSSSGHRSRPAIPVQTNDHLVTVRDTVVVFLRVAITRAPRQTRRQPPVDPEVALSVCARLAAAVARVTRVAVERDRGADGSADVLAYSVLKRRRDRIARLELTSAGHRAHQSFGVQAHACTLEVAGQRRAVGGIRRSRSSVLT